MHDIPCHIDDEEMTRDVQELIDRTEIQMPKDFDRNYKVRRVLIRDAV